MAATDEMMKRIRLGIKYSTEDSGKKKKTASRKNDSILYLLFFCAKTSPYQRRFVLSVNKIERLFKIVHFFF